MAQFTVTGEVAIPMFAELQNDDDDQKERCQNAERDDHGSISPLLTSTQ